MGNIAAAQFRIGDPNAAQETFDQASVREGTRTGPMIPAIQAIIEAQVAAGDFVAALETVASIGDAGERLDALTGIDVRTAPSIRRSWNGFSG